MNSHAGHHRKSSYEPRTGSVIRSWPIRASSICAPAIPQRRSRPCVSPGWRRCNFVIWSMRSMCYPSPEGASAWARVRALEAGARALRARGPWDLGMCLPNSFSSAWLFARAGVRWRRGYAADGRGFLLHDKLAWETHSQQHRAEAYVHVLPAAVRPQGPVQHFWEEPAHTRRPRRIRLALAGNLMRGGPGRSRPWSSRRHTRIGSWLRAAWPCPGAGQWNGSRRWPDIWRTPQVSPVSW